MRFTLFWIKAPKLPSVMERAADTQINQNQLAPWWLPPAPAVVNSTRSRTAKAAALGPVDISATTGAGAPSYTSGVQIWNGADATLNPRPTIINAVALSTSRLGAVEPAPRAPWILTMSVVPVAPNINATPYKKNAVANDPSRKYLSEDSVLEAVRRRYPARM